MPMQNWRELLEKGLNEDSAHWDWSTRASVSASGAKAAPKLSAQIVAKSAGIWAGSPALDAAAAVARDRSLDLSLSSSLRDGDAFKKGSTLVTLKGDPAILLALERPLLNLLAYSAGIATQASVLVAKVRRASGKKATPPRVVPTRKTLPGYRDLVIHSALAGGAHPHRVSLSGGVLLKENHIRAAQGIKQAISRSRAIAPHGLKIEIEITNESELAQALDCGAEVIMLDNFSPAQVKRALKRFGERIKNDRVCIEVSGGINEKNISTYALPGVDVISCGSISHSVAAADLSFLVQS